MARRASSAGFSLIELMVVVVLIAIMTGLILPEMKGTYEDALLRSTSRKLVDAFHVAYSQAVALNQIHRVRFDMKEGRWFVERKLRDPDQKGAFGPPPNLSLGDGALDKRISVQVRRLGEESSDSPETAAPLLNRDDAAGPGRPDVVVFYPDGTADAAEILLRDRDGFRRALRINPTTAHVRVVELERE